MLLFVALWFILRGDSFYVLPCVILFLCFFSPFRIAITSLGEERPSFGAFRTFVRFALVWFCLFPLPFGVWEGLRFVIVALPGLFSYPLSCSIFQWPILLSIFFLTILHTSTACRIIRHSLKYTEALEEYGFHPIYCCMDGSSNDRAFLKMHFPSNSLPSKITQKFASANYFLDGSLPFIKENTQQHFIQWW